MGWIQRAKDMVGDLNREAVNGTIAGFTYDSRKDQITMTVIVNGETKFIKFESDFDGGLMFVTIDE
jgi:hypothetical protein